MSNALILNGRSLNLVSGMNDKEKTKIEKAFGSVVKTLKIYANAQFSVCKALYDFERTGYWKKAYKAPNELYKDFKDFAKDYFGLERSAVNDALKIQKKYFEIYDENGNKVPYMIGEHEAKDYSKTALIQLSVLDDDELQNAVAEGLKPTLSTREINEIKGKVHAPKGKNAHNTDKSKTHPCSNMDYVKFEEYIRGAHKAFTTSEIVKSLNISNDSAITIQKAFYDYLQAWNDAIEDAINTEVHEVHNEPSEVVTKALNK